MSTYIQEGNKLAFELENLIREYVLNTGIFVPSNNGFRYKSYFINQLEDRSWEVSLKRDTGYKVIANTFLKISAFTICRLHDNQHLSQIKFIMDLDETYRKNYIDAHYFKAIIKQSKVSLQRETAEVRYDLVNARADRAKQSLKKQFVASLSVYIPAEICKKTEHRC